jgi:hypothetical protein
VRVDELVGLRIATVDPATAFATDWVPHTGDIDLVRVGAPDPGCWELLAGAGFVLKPDRVTWLAETGADEREFLARISRKEREGVAKARRAVAGAGLAWRLIPLDEAGWESFLTLYERGVARMRNGLAVARNHRDAVLSRRERFFLLGAYAGAELHGAAIGEWCPEIDLARLRFSAVTGEQRAASLSRALYLEAARAARDAGYARMTLGNDPNLYGHLVMPGLFAFKARLGFVPVPSTQLDPADGEDEAALVLSMKALANPSFMLGYPAPVRGRDLIFDVLARGPDADMRLYTTCLPAPVRLHHVP